MKTIELPHRAMTLAYDDVGSGVPVVLLHAFPFDRNMWAPQIAQLSAAGFRVLAPDLPEFGDSTPGSEVITIERAADAVADFLRALVIDKAVIGGLSMGGYVAMAFARRHPQILAGLILADTKAAPDNDEAKAKRDELIAAVKATGPLAAANALMPKLVSDQTRQTNPDAVETLRQLALRQTSAGIIAGLYALRDRPDAAPGLPAIAVPTLVIVGEHDTVTPPLAAARLAGSDSQECTGSHPRRGASQQRREPGRVQQRGHQVPEEDRVRSSSGFGIQRASPLFNDRTFRPGPSGSVTMPILTQPAFGPRTALSYVTGRCADRCLDPRLVLHSRSCVEQE